MKCNIVWLVVGVKRLIKKGKQSRARYRGKHVGSKDTGIQTSTEEVLR